MSHTVNLLPHVAGFGMYAFTLYYSFYLLHIPFMVEKFSQFDPGQMKYLTIWDVVSTNQSSIIKKTNTLLLFCKTKKTIKT